jgi:hypothetical protein
MTETSILALAVIVNAISVAIVAISVAIQGWRL